MLGSKLLPILQDAKMTLLRDQRIYQEQVDAARVYLCQHSQIAQGDNRGSYHYICLGCGHEEFAIQGDTALYMGKPGRHPRLLSGTPIAHLTMDELQILRMPMP
jgi:hypothetical protein